MERGFKETLDLMKNWVRVVEYVLAISIVLEAIFVIIIGIASNHLGHAIYGKKATWALLTSTALYLGLLVVKFW